MTKGKDVIIEIENFFEGKAIAGLVMAALATTFGAQSTLETTSCSYRVTTAVYQSEKDAVYAYVDGMKKMYELLAEVK